MTTFTLSLSLERPTLAIALIDLHLRLIAFIERFSIITDSITVTDIPRAHIA